MAVFCDDIDNFKILFEYAIKDERFENFYDLLKNITLHNSMKIFDHVLDKISKDLFDENLEIAIERKDNAVIRLMSSCVHRVGK